MTVSCKDFLMHYSFSSISTCHLPVQAKQPSLQLKVNSNYVFTCKVYFKLNSNSLSFLSKACVCKDKISALSHIIECYGLKLKHYKYHPYTILWKLSFCIPPCSETPLAKCDQIVLLYGGHPINREIRIVCYFVKHCL